MCSSKPVVPWYRKQYTGAKLQAMWQIAFGVIGLCTFVIVPTFFDYWMNVQKEKFSIPYIETMELPRDRLQRMVYEKRLEFRRKIAEGIEIEVDKKL